MNCIPQILIEVSFTLTPFLDGVVKVYFIWGKGLWLLGVSSLEEKHSGCVHRGLLYLRQHTLWCLPVEQLQLGLGTASGVEVIGAERCRSLLTLNLIIWSALQRQSVSLVCQQVLATVRTVLSCCALVVEEKSVNHRDVLLAQRISELQILEVVGPVGIRGKTVMCLPCSCTCPWASVLGQFFSGNIQLWFNLKPPGFGLFAYLNTLWY